MTSISIRQAGIDDFPAISSLVRDPDELFMAFPTASYPLTLKQLHLVADERSDLTVVVDRSAIIGFANLYGIVPDQCAFIGNVILKQRYRGKGAGKRLVLHMLDIIFRVYDLPQARISVFQNNIPALSLYKKLGFRIYCKEERLDAKQRVVVLLHMQLGRSEFLTKQNEMTDDNRGPQG